MLNWRVFQGSARGSHHVDHDLPCQDFAYHQRQGETLCAVVCDGAGSADYSDEGAQFFATELVQRLLNDPPKDLNHLDTLKEHIANHIAACRLELKDRLKEDRSLRDYAATLVGCMLTPLGGVFFHIGDGFAVFQAPNDSALLSLPENGEYASETFFVTGEDWLEHLRLTLLPAPQPGTYLGLMSDGAATFAIDKLRTGFFPAFINPVMDYLKKVDEENGNLALLNLLESPKTLSITSDDKTLLLACVN